MAPSRCQGRVRIHRILLPAGKLSAPTLMAGQEPEAVAIDPGADA